MLSIFRALSAVLALLAIALVAALITMRLAIHGAEVRVPNLSGLTMQQMTERLRARGLEAGIDGHFYSNTQPAGRVLTQSPQPGTLVRKSWRVRVTESLGPQKTAIPSVEGMDENLATITIRRVGLQVKTVASMPYAYAPDNTVIAQSPLARATDVLGPRVSILLALPQDAEPPADVMPDLTGESFTDAAWTVTRAGFKLAPLPVATASAAPPASAANPPASAAPPGTVIGQQPAPGERVVPGSTIQLTVQP
jgi:beta-lactam-binding protein with PASTA domain